MLSGKVPGNRNLDNVDPDLAKFEHLLYTSKTLEVGKIKAATVTSFGFGQAGGQLLLVNPDYFLATLPADDVDAYVALRDARRRNALTFSEDVVAGRRKYVEVKNEAPYPSNETKDWLVQRNRRVAGGNTASAQTDSEVNLKSDVAQVSTAERFDFLPKTQAATQQALANAMQDVMQQNGVCSSAGIVVESVTNSRFSEESFLERNYTKREMESCGNLSVSRMSRDFAGLWAGKKAVVKVLGNAGATLKSAGSAMQEVELVRSESGAVVCQFHGFAAEEAARVGVQEVMVSLSYADDMAVAAAVAK